MEKQHSINVNHEKNYVELKFMGNIFGDQIAEAWEELLSNKYFAEKKYNLLTDYRFCQMHFMDAESTNEFLKSVINIIDGKKEALVIQDPDNTARSMFLISNVSAELNYCMKIFYSHETAIQWLSDG
jgi:hypothetical protein